MTHRTAQAADLPQLLEMVEDAKEYFRSQSIDQWQKGEPGEKDLSASISRGEILILEENEILGMLAIVPGPEESYRTLKGSWLNTEPYYAFHRVCVRKTAKGQGIAGRLFSIAEGIVKDKGFTNVRIDTHPDNRSMQKALSKNGYQLCGTLTLIGGSEGGDSRLGYHKIL